MSFGVTGGLLQRNAELKSCRMDQLCACASVSEPYKCSNIVIQSAGSASSLFARTAATRSSSTKSSLHLLRTVLYAPRRTTRMIIIVLYSTYVVRIPLRRHTRYCSSPPSYVHASRFAVAYSRCTMNSSIVPCTQYSSRRIVDGRGVSEGTYSSTRSSMYSLNFLQL